MFYRGYFLQITPVFDEKGPILRILILMSSSFLKRISVSLVFIEYVSQHIAVFTTIKEQSTITDSINRIFGVIIWKSNSNYLIRIKQWQQKKLIQ